MTKEQKLLQRPVEEDTQIILENVVDFKECVGLMELWRWESIRGSSIILLKEDIDHLNKDELIKSLLEQVNVAPTSKTTFKEEGDYFYLNYNFIVS